jgi:hypothetical protein
MIETEKKPVKAATMGRPPKYPLRTMKVDESFFVPFNGRPYYKVRQYFYNVFKQHLPNKFKIAIEEKGIRVGRVK